LIITQDGFIVSGHRRHAALCWGASCMLNKTKPVNLNGRKHKLTDRQARFVEEYIMDGNGKRAAIMVGVPEKTAASVACQWLTLPQYAHVAAAVAAGLEEKRRACQVDAQSMVMDLLNIARFDMGELAHADGSPKHVRELPPHARQALQELELVTEVIWAKGKRGKKVRKVRRYLVPKKGCSKLEAYKQIAALCGLEAPKKFEGAVAVFDWEQFAKGPPEPPKDEVTLAIEAKLLAAGTEMIDGNDSHS